MRELGIEAEAAVIGFPAPPDKAGKTVLKASNLPRLENLPVSDELERIPGIPVFKAFPREKLNEAHCRTYQKCIFHGKI